MPLYEPFKAEARIDRPAYRSSREWLADLAVLVLAMVVIAALMWVRRMQVGA